MTNAHLPERVLVLGASCQIGTFLLPSLLGNGIKINALSRTPQANQPGLEWLTGALPDDLPPALIPDATQWDGIISYGPLSALAQWLTRFHTAPAPALVAISSMSVISKASSPVPDERAMVTRMLSAEQTIIKQCERLGMRWTILRPTLIYGAGLDHNFTPIACRARRWRWFPLPGGRGLRQPVHAADVAEASWRSVCRPEAAGYTLSLGGGERLQVSEMFARVRRSLELWSLPVPLWRWTHRLLAHTIPSQRGPLLRLDQDLIADNHKITELLDITPRPFMPTAQMWHVPAKPVLHDNQGAD